MEEFFAWLQEELVQSALLPSNPFTEAARYALKLKTELQVFLSDPAVPVDTNHLERALGDLEVRARARSAPVLGPTPRSGSRS